jgi:hypothetical protein
MLATNEPGTSCCDRSSEPLQQRSSSNITTRETLFYSSWSYRIKAMGRTALHQPSVYGTKVRVPLEAHCSRPKLHWGFSSKGKKKSGRS